VTQVHIAERLAELEERTANVAALPTPLADPITVQVCLVHKGAHAAADCPRRKALRRVPCLMLEVPVDQAFATPHLRRRKSFTAAPHGPCKALPLVTIISALCNRKNTACLFS